jgi:glycosyltransferase involved in cell wall biosynthesis
MDSPAVSVILPVYNGALFLEASVSSILRQTFRDFELIVVNDSSTDNSELLLQQLASQDIRIRVITIPHAGVAEAFNCGMREARGEYIARMDADDEMLPDRLAMQVEYLQKHPEIGVVSCLVQYGGNRATQQGYAIHVDWINTLTTHEEIVLNRFAESPICNPSVLFRAELFRTLGGAITGDFPEDYEMWLRWMENGVRFAKIPKFLFTWNDPPSRITRNDNRYSSEAFDSAKRKYLINFLKTNAHNKNVFLCGAGRVTRKKAKELLKGQITVGGFIDIDPAKIGRTFDGYKVHSLHEFHSPNQGFILSLVGNRGAGSTIRNILLQRQFKEGHDFIIAG